MSIYPVIGIPVAVAGIWVAVRRVRRTPFDGYAITVVSGNAVVLSIAVAAWIWSFVTGLYGIAVSPWPN